MIYFEKWLRFNKENGLITYQDKIEKILTLSELQSLKKLVSDLELKYIDKKLNDNIINKLHNKHLQQYEYNKQIEREERRKRDVQTRLDRLEKDRLWPTKPTKIYFILDKSTGYVKIGYSQNVSKRFSAIKCCNTSVELITFFNGIIQDETNLHNLLEDKKISGEWYNLDLSDIEKIGKYSNKISVKLLKFYLEI
jgi:hypothetical protein